MIGIADARWGEVGHLFAVALPGRAVTTSALIEFLESRLARFKIPKNVTLLDALPRNGAGKLVKAVLRDHLARAIGG